MKINQNGFAAVLAITLLATTCAVASDKDDVLKVTQQFIDSGSTGDMQAALATCAPEMSIIDEFPPYEWHGEGACEKWANDFVAHAKKNDIADAVVTVDPPVHVEVTGDHAYVVLRADYTFKMKGKEIKEVDATWTVSLHKGDNGWRMSGFSWSKS
jgi:ketosteroid isomerase-like protein